MAKGQDPNSKPYDFYVNELKTYLNWALSNLNKYKDELIDVGFVVYLELYIKLFKQSSNLGKDFLIEFMNIFKTKYENYINKLLQFKFVDQLDQLFFLNAGYNASNKYIIILSKNCKRILLNWLNIYHNNIINIILLERVEFIDGEMFNHSSVNVFKRYFILKYGIDPESIHKYRKPFLGLFIKDVETNSYKMNNLLIEPLKETKILFGLPCEMFTNDYGQEVNTYTNGINGEFTKMEDYRKLIPLPRPGSLIHESLRSLYQLQAENRNMSLNPYILSYNFANVSSINCSTVSDFDGRYAALGQRDGSILLWDLVKSECENAYKDIACIVGKDIAVQSVNKAYPSYFEATSGNSSGYAVNQAGVQAKNYEKMESNRDYLMINGHDGVINCLKFGENGQVLLSAGLDSTINLYTMSDTTASNTIKCVYYNSCYPSGSYGGTAVGVPAGGGDAHAGAANAAGRTGAALRDDLSQPTSPANRSSTPTGRGKRAPANAHASNPPTGNTTPKPSPASAEGSELAAPASARPTGGPGGNSVVDLDYSRFGYYFSSCDLNGYCKLWATDRSFPIRTLKLTSSSFSSSRFHPNSSLMSVVSNDSRVHLYDLKSLNAVLQLDVPVHASTASGLGSASTSLRSCSGANTLNGVAWSKNGVILGVYSDSRVLLYDVRVGRPFERIDSPGARIASIDFSYATTLVAVTTKNSELSLWGFNDFNKYMVATDPANEKKAGNKKLNELKDGEKKLIKSYRFNKTHLLNSTFTPENVLITLGISTI